MITDPVTLPPDAPVSAALELMARYKISGVPIVDGNGTLVGILTNRDLRFVEDHDQPIENVMRKAPLVTAPVGTTLEQAKEILWQHRIEKLPIVDDATGELRGLITVKDIKKQTEYPHATAGRAGPPPGRRRRRRRARRARAGRGARRRRRRPARRRHLPRPQHRACSTW